jgi:hypothetical protein
MDSPSDQDDGGMIEPACCEECSCTPRGRRRVIPAPGARRMTCSDVAALKEIARAYYERRKVLLGW